MKKEKRCFVPLNLLNSNAIVFRKNRWNSTFRICEVLQRKSRHWCITSRKWPSNSSIIGEPSPSFCHRHCPHARRVTTRWREKSIIWEIFSWHPASTSWTPLLWIAKASLEDWPTNNWRALGSEGKYIFSHMDILQSLFYIFNNCVS